MTTFMQSRSYGHDNDIILTSLDGVEYWHVGAIRPNFDMGEIYMYNIERTSEPFIYEAVANDHDG